MNVAKEPVFDPNKNYTWSPDSVFPLKGSEFALIFNTLRAFLSTPEAQKILMASAGHDVLESVLAKAVEDGVAVEKESKQ
jgi:hypothetical protein